MKNSSTSRSGAIRPQIALPCLLVACLIPGAGAAGRDRGDGDRKPVVLVPPFENVSKVHQNINYEVANGTDPDRPKRRFLVDRLTEAPRSILENRLVNMQGLTVLERQRIDALLVETQFGLSGLVDPEKAIKLGKMLGANLVVMGTVMDLHSEVVPFQGYGIKTKSSKAICQIRLRLVDIETGKIQFNKIIPGSRQFFSSNFGGQDLKNNSDPYYGAIEAAFEKLEGDAEFEAALFGRKPTKSDASDGDGMVEVEFAPKPDNCDIEINGKYVGGSPLKRRLPVGKEFKIRIGKGGYKDWEGVIVPEKGLRITRELGPSR